MYGERTCLNGCCLAEPDGTRVRCNAEGLWPLPQPLVDPVQVKICPAFVPGPTTVYQRRDGFYESVADHAARLFAHVGVHHVPWGVQESNVGDARWVLRMKETGRYNCHYLNPRKRGMRREGISKGRGWWGLTAEEIRQALLVDAFHRPITPDGELALEGRFGTSHEEETDITQLAFPLDDS